MHVIVRWTGTYNFLMHQASALKLIFFSFVLYKMKLTLVTGPLSRTRFIPMAEHESERTYICTDNTRISEKTFFVPLGFGGYLLTIVIADNRMSSSSYKLYTLQKRCTQVITSPDGHDDFAYEVQYLRTIVYGSFSLVIRGWSDFTPSLLNIASRLFAYTDLVVDYVIR